jgi:hypothetical protein
MSIAMTVVLPAPVASFSARRDQFGVGVLVGGGEVVEERLPLPSLRRDLGQPDGRLDGLDLAEERPTPLNLWCRQCWSRRAVSGVTCHWLGLGSARHWSTWRAPR